MFSQRLIGLVLLVVATLILAFGLNASQSAADQFSRALTGSYRGSTNWYMVGGIVLGVLGLFLTTIGVHRYHLH